ncbi:hypothetical protein MAR_000667, partial [Mya arenaria]
MKLLRKILEIRRKTYCAFANEVDVTDILNFYIVRKHQLNVVGEMMFSACDIEETNETKPYVFILTSTAFNKQ